LAAKRRIRECTPPGRAQRQPADARVAAMAPKPPQVPVDSPAANWMARAKAAAAPQEFAALLEEVQTLFPGDESAKRETALLWLLGLWITRDAEGALDYVAGKSRDSTLQGYFGLMLVKVAPEKVISIFQKDLLGYPFTTVVLESLAKTDPLTFLKIEPAGFQQNSPFARALEKLAERDPAAAAAVLAEKRANYPSATVEAALVAIVNAWTSRNSEAVRDWLTGLKEPDLRHRAQHAWLTALAKTDAAAAQRELAKMDAGAWLTEDDGRVAIVAALARENLPAAVREMKRLTDSVKATGPAAETNDPFASGGSPPDMWRAVAEAVAPRLPRAPAQWLTALREIGKDCEMDAESIDSLQRQLADSTVRKWDAEAALEAMKLLLPASSPPQDELSKLLRTTLSRRLTQADPELSLQYYASLTEAGRKELSFEFISDIINAGDSALTLRMAPLVPLERWWMSGANTLAGELGKTPEAAKAIMEALPLNNNYQEAHSDFTGQWARRDPEAAAQWVASQPENIYAAKGLAETWAGFDATAASAWAAGLPEGKLRDGAARGLVNALAPQDPEAAWQWAADISIPYQAAQAYRDLAGWWGNKAPAEFVAALNEAMKHGDESDRRAALESLKQPPPERYINP
jgi:hypothetical protein